MALLTAIGTASCAAAAGLSPEQIEKRTDDILAKIPVDRRVELLAGVNNFSTRGFPEAGLPQYLFSDGPLGVKADRREYAKTGGLNDGRSTAFPSDLLLAATWDRSLAEAEGVALGKESRSYGIHVLLGPAVNICRLPVGGRNFEYMGEDPLLASQMCVPYIVGLQSQGVAACVKHFAANNQDRDRTEYNAIISERALHEIYFPAFEAAVRDGHVRTIMTSYNRLNGTYTASSRSLVGDVLRDQWKFDGLCMSDWDSIHETLRTINDGVDLEMPEPKWMSPEKVRPLVASGTVSQQTIDVKLRRLIRLGVEMGWNDSPQLRPLTQADDAAHDQLALTIARAGITLLKNDNGFLPLDRTKIKTLAVVGPGAAAYVSGEGSSHVSARHPRTILDGLKQVAGPGVKVVAIPMTGLDVHGLAAASAYERHADAKPLKAEYFDNTDLSGVPVATLADDVIQFNWKQNRPIPQIAGPKYSVRWTGTIKAPADGEYLFTARSDDGSRVFLDGQLILDNWRDQQAHTELTRVGLKAGQTHDLRVEYFNSARDGQMTFGWGPAVDPVAGEHLAALQSADAVVCCVTTPDGEGDDRPYDLPSDQQRLLAQVTAANAKTVVVMNSGGNFAMQDWIDRVPSLVNAYYSGQAGGLATAEILFGDINPSGRLPMSFEKSWDQAVGHVGYPGDAKKNVNYAEGVYVGYRYFDTHKIEPRFPFGHGLSYTTFKMSDVKVTAGNDHTFTVTAAVTNTGPRDGATVAQLYVRPPAGTDRPFQELKGLERIELKPNETKQVTMHLNGRSFAMWDESKHDWAVAAGEYELAIGQSSRSIDATTKVTID